MFKSMPQNLKIIIILAFLVSVFFITVTIKMNSPINRPANESGVVAAVWYDRHTAVSAEITDEWTLDPRIPVNYIPVPGETNLYMVVDDSGLVIAYMVADFQEDGSILWAEYEEPISTIYTPVDDLDDVYSYVDENGDEAFLKYIRNDDNTFAFVDVDEYGIPLTQGMDASTITEMFSYTGEGNIYALLNSNGVVTGYYERYKNADGNYVWQLASLQNQTNTPGNTNGLVGVNTENRQISGLNNVYIVNPGQENTSVTNSDGTITETAKIVNTETLEGVTYTYETTVISIYSSDGTLMKTSSDGPYLVNQTIAQSVPAISQVEATLNAEYARMTFLVQYDTATASEILALLNARRNENGLSTLTMDMSSDIYKIACIRAADMAIYNTASTTSATYGTIADLCSRYSLNIIPLENIYKTSNLAASDIHLIFQANETTRAVRESTVTQCAIVIAVYNGQQYIVELYAY